MDLHVTINGCDLTLGAPLLVLLGLGVGVVSGLFGVAGGFLLTPALNILFGLPMPQAVACTFGQGLPVGMFSAYRYSRGGDVDYRFGCLMGLASFFGTAAGNRLLLALAAAGGTVRLGGAEFRTVDLAVYTLLAVLMLLSAINIYREAAAGGSEEAGANRAVRWLHALRLPPRLAFPASGIAALPAAAPVAVGLAVGVICGLLGIGGGLVFFPLLVYLFGLPTRTAVGTSAFMTIFAGAYGSVANYRAGLMPLAVVGVLLAGSLLGASIGVSLNRRLGGRHLRKYFCAVLALAILTILAKVIYTIVAAH